MIHPELGMSPHSIKSILFSKEGKDGCWEAKSIPAALHTVCYMNKSTYTK